MVGHKLGEFAPTPVSFAVMQEKKIKPKNKRFFNNGIKKTFKG
jgi:ribosomal protein S19